MLQVDGADIEVPDPWGLPPAAYAEMFDLLHARAATCSRRARGDRRCRAELVDGLGVTAATPVSGGDIARAYRLDTPDGPLFLKTLADPMPGLFEREAAGLRALRATGAIGVPEVVREDPTGLVLEWIDVGGRTAAQRGRPRPPPRRRSTARPGRASAASTPHPAATSARSPSTSRRPTTGPTFYVERRVRAADRTGRRRSAASTPTRATLAERAAARAADLCGPPEPPALLHGDLWAGNRLVDRAGANWLIDPAVYWGHREVDLAMMQLFGGFGADAFDAYDEAHPLAAGWRDRVAWYQLVPLLVHAILFGGGYGRAAMDVLVRSFDDDDRHAAPTPPSRATGTAYGRPLRDRPVVRGHDHPAGDARRRRSRRCGRRSRCRGWRT